MHNIKWKFISYFFVGTLYLSCVLLWEFVSPSYGAWSLVLPPPSKIISVILDHSVSLWIAVVHTIWQAVLGLATASLVAVFLAIFLQLFPIFSQLIYPLLYAWQAAPVIATASLVFLWFGFGTTGNIFFIWSATFFPIYVGISQSLQRVNRQFLFLLNSYGASKLQIFFITSWPRVILGFCNGLRIATTYLISITITAQWMSGQNGLGTVLLRSRKSYDYPLMMAVIVLSVLLSLLFILLSVQFENFVSSKYHLKEHTSL